VPPIWLMRQAGRYLPEYREVRTQADGFLNLCYTPELAAEVTMQPIRRYDFDAAILFSDILVVPHALGQDVWFVEGEGPRLEPISDAEGLAQLDPTATEDRFSSIYETVDRVRAQLPSDKALIGFCGAPWTVATYMVAGRGTPDQAPARLWAYNDEAAFTELIQLLTDVSIDYLGGQIEAGVNVVQIFDSWAGSLPDDQLDRWVVQPTQRIVSALKARYPHIPVIGFPRAVGSNAPDYVRATGVDAIGCDTSMPLPFMAGELAATGVAVQGNLDPLLLVAGGSGLERRIETILSTMSGIPFVFNLGHGIVPATPTENVTRMLEIVRSYGKNS
ncbi:MAG: uroporphyrinogen decarboxylase, partial [Hyphomicrobiaceae bacterium]